MSLQGLRNSLALLCFLDSINALQDCTGFFSSLVIFRSNTACTLATFICSSLSSTSSFMVSIRPRHSASSSPKLLPYISS
uniref:Putative secreted protein n=1 Tax=Panstrongylus lignarius TaxID=156445 RepID=A0A224Y506_9HEMI